MKRVAVIGAGSSGLVSIKSCLEEGLNPQCYELTDKVGGIWNYQEDNCPAGKSSVYRGLITNTSKVMTSYSDFPSPEHFPTFWTPSIAAEYYSLYAKEFGLMKHILFEHRVVKVTPKSNEKWLIRVLNLKTGEEFEDTFDAVMVCSGATSYPNIPTITGQDTFKGIQIHSQQYRIPEAFENKRVVVLGLGNSGCDVATECSTRAKEVYLSTRRRAWIHPRIIKGNIPVDSLIGNRWQSFLTSILPSNWIDDKSEGVLNSHWDHEALGLKPKHRASKQYPCFNDGLPLKLLSGQVKLMGEISRITPTSVIVKGEKEPIDADVIIYGTGYKVKYPFLEEFYDAENEIARIYKLIFPVEHPGLAFVGLLNAAGPNAIVFEIQARWIARIFSGKQSLPRRDIMINDSQMRFQNYRDFYGKDHFLKNHTNFGPYMDEIASEIGAKPNMWKLLIKDPALYWACLMGPKVGQQYRLNGPHSWSKARDYLVNYKQNRLLNMTGNL